MNFVEELRWRGMVHDIVPGTEEMLVKEKTTAYVGIDPTADSLHIGHLVSIMMLKHFQLAGHKPITLIGGATGMIGDPSGKSEERNLLDESVLHYNQECIKKQLEKFLDFSESENMAEIVNNYDWMSGFGLIGFLRDVGKHITVNYMVAKDSVSKRMNSGSGISYTEFTYQLVQAYDFYWLYTRHNCKLQMGGADQWGNITTGTELIRRICGGEAYALTCPLITKADGSKFGKTESGNVWLDPQKTSPYKFYQFWLNTSDEEAEKYIKIFTLLNRETIQELIDKHRQAPHLRALQKELAKHITIRVHSEEEFNAAVQASEVLFGKGSIDNLKTMDDKMLLAVFEGVPHKFFCISDIENGLSVEDFLVTTTGFFASRSEVRRMLAEGSLYLNKDKIMQGMMINSENLIKNKYLLFQKGKKNYYLAIVK